MAERIAGSCVTVRNAGLGSLSNSNPSLEWAKKSSERSVPRRSVERNLSSRSVNRGSLRCLCPFSSVATSTARNCPNRGEMQTAICRESAHTTFGMTTSRMTWCRPPLKRLGVQVHFQKSYHGIS